MRRMAFDDVAGTDRAAQSGREFFGGELRNEGGAMEGAVAGDHGAGGGFIAVVPAERAIAHGCSGPITMRR